MGNTVKIWTCAFYLILFHFNHFVLTNPTQNLKSLDGLRPAEAECKKYKKMVSEIDQSVQTADTDAEDLLAKPGEFPYMVALGYSIGEDKSRDIEYYCGGTLVSERHVLTAAHCTSNPLEQHPIEVMIGATDRDNSIRTEEIQRISISRIIIHPQFQRKYRYFDIAILELKEPIKLTIFVQPACLMTEPLTTETKGANSSLVVLGWSRNEVEKITPEKLLKAGRQKFISTSECSKFYDQKRPSSIPNGLDDGMICVAKSDDDVEEDACSGVSGAPILIPSTNYGFLVAGFPSFGYLCNANLPTVAISVYKYLDWIENQVWSTKTL